MNKWKIQSLTPTIKSLPLKRTLKGDIKYKVF